VIARIEPSDNSTKPSWKQGAMRLTIHGAILSKNISQNRAGGRYWIKEDTCSVRFFNQGRIVLLRLRRGENTPETASQQTKQSPYK